MGANPPHATQRFELASIFGECLAPGYKGAVDMLTRASKKTDAAPDVSVFPEVPAPVTGGRQLEEIAFEVLDNESLEHVTTKTRRLAKRGARRVFYLHVTDHTVFEWQHASGEWAALDAESEIRDRCFVVPIPVRAFVQRVLAHETVARALLATENPVIVQAVRDARTEGRRDGELQRARASVLRVFARRALFLTDAQRERVARCDDLATLEQSLDQAVDAASAEDVFG